MAKGRGPWQDAKRAWERLKSWYASNANDIDSSGQPSLDALADVGTLRRLLDEVELAAVYVARLHGKSWAEIATRLGVTRQSAWERWRELDQPQAGRAAVAVRSANPLVVVPDVAGLTLIEALRAFGEGDLRPAAADPDGPPLSSQTPSDVIVDQSPEAGARVPAGSPVRLWFRSGGGGEGGVREPRRPGPDPKSAREMLPEPVDDALG